MKSNLILIFFLCIGLFACVDKASDNQNATVNPADQEIEKVLEAVEQKTDEAEKAIDDLLKDI